MTRSLTLACLVSCAASTLPGCASGDVRTATLGQPVTLQVSEQIALPGDAMLRYVGVTADSRCPPGVQCIRAGDADVAFEFTPAGGSAVPGCTAIAPRRESTTADSGGMTTKAMSQPRIGIDIAMNQAIDSPPKTMIDWRA